MSRGTQPNSLALPADNIRLCVCVCVCVCVNSKITLDPDATSSLSHALTPLWPSSSRIMQCDCVDGAPLCVLCVRMHGLRQRRGAGLVFRV